ncbi:MAG: DUF2971 domain-containing protein [Brevundimonas sp.]|uniref:DUF2971 domain-containing protein n=1 Tax=Brevundimonas sp. TaxID=1871086 RepID=UPI0025B881F7|nr:DUF2971 domain-containing protein [Brevundimonas sp.]MBX3477317.1 DUF2971 domain-containing protein [Brevundimonas sp.]
MAPPACLYRFRPLEDALLDRELTALRESFLYSPPFGAMNDPMEAFYETGGPGDRIVEAMLGPAAGGLQHLYGLLSETIDRFALVSFAGTFENLPMWAYYASNFAGMCLEFDTDQLTIGDFQNETLRPVTYAHKALSPLSVADMAPDRLEEAIIARITRKRAEWSHEKEWRYVTGEVGRKHYLDDALRRVFIGPRAREDYVTTVCDVLDRRPVEVLQGEIKGFELTFRTIKPARPIGECERIGAGIFDDEEIYGPEALSAFFGSSYEAFLEACRRTAARPNMEKFAGIDLSTDRDAAAYVWTVYRLRNGRDVYDKRYFDRRLRLLPRRA